jgi:hypothetical protein
MTLLSRLLRRRPAPVRDGSTLPCRPRLECLEDRSLPSTAPGIFALGSLVGSTVDVYDAASGQRKYEFNAFEPGFDGGVRVAVGNYHGVDVIVAAAGPGGFPLVRVFRGSDGAQLSQFEVFDRSFSGGLWVAAGDLNGDGGLEVVTGSDAGFGPVVNVHDIQGDQIGPNILAFENGFTGGVRVAVGDFSGTGKDDIAAAAGPGGFPFVQIIDGRSFQREQRFEVYGHTFSDGVFVAAGKLDNSGMDRLVVSPGGGQVFDQPVLREFDAAGNLLHDYVTVDLGESLNDSSLPVDNGGVSVATATAFGESQDVILVDSATDHSVSVQTLDATFSKLAFQFSSPDLFAFDNLSSGSYC